MSIENTLNEVKAKVERLKTTNVGRINTFYNMLSEELENFAKDMKLEAIISNPTKIRSVHHNIKKIRKNAKEMMDINNIEISRNESMISNIEKGINLYEFIKLYEEVIEFNNHLFLINDILGLIEGKTISFSISRCGNTKDDISIEQFIDIMEISELLRELKYHIFDMEDEQLIQKHNEMVQAINQIIGIGTIDNYIKNGEEVTKVPAYERMKAFTEFAKIQVVK